MTIALSTIGFSSWIITSNEAKEKVDITPGIVHLLKEFYRPNETKGTSEGKDVFSFNKEGFINNGEFSFIKKDNPKSVTSEGKLIYYFSLDLDKLRSVIKSESDYADVVIKESLTESNASVIINNCTSTFNLGYNQDNGDTYTSFASSYYTFSKIDNTLNVDFKLKDLLKNTTFKYIYIKHEFSFSFDLLTKDFETTIYDKYSQEEKPNFDFNIRLEANIWE